MDLRLMVKEMIQSGMSDQDILQSLRELGIENVEQVLKQAVEEERKEAAKKQALKPAAAKTGAAQKPAMKEISFGETEGGTVREGGVEEEHGEEEEAAEDAGKPLFDKQGKIQEHEEKEEVLEGKDLFGGPPKKGGRRITEQEMGTEAERDRLGAEEEEAVGEVPKLEIVNVSPEGEKAKTLEEMLGKQLMERPAQSTLANVGEVERKLDETIALLKSLQQINQKILEANREMLFKLKMQK